jgi:hypothetical protein
MDGTKPIAVVYGSDAPPLEAETAIAIAETLESASGIQVDAIASREFAGAKKFARTPILVGSQKTNPALKNFQVPASETGFIKLSRQQDGKTAVIISGRDSQQIENAGMDFIVSYWQSAKDAAARRSGLAEKQLPRGGDATRLP